jgi:hypothetical protein
MAKLGINTGIVPDDGLGDSLLEGAIKINDNFDEIYNYFGDGTNLTFTGESSSQWVTTSSGIHTLSNVGIGTTNPTETLTVVGDARVTGILTIGTASITLDGSSNTITVGSGVTIDGSTGIIEATSLVVGGTTLTGAAVTSITAGSGISINQSTGNVTITATGGGGGGGGESYWSLTSVGIHTLSNVGIGTTNPTGALTVKGNTSLETLSVSGVSTFAGITTVTGPTLFTKQLNVSGVVTASKFVGDGSGLTNLPGGGGGGESYWTQTSAGIHTLSNVGIGSTIPRLKLDVSGDILISDGISIGSASTFITNASTSKNNLVFGRNAGLSFNQIGNEVNIAFGNGSLSNLGQWDVGIFNIALGESTLFHLGKYGDQVFTFEQPTGGDGNTGIGHGSLNELGNESVSPGGYTYDNNTALGYLSLFNLLRGSNNISIGSSSGITLQYGSNNTIIGVITVSSTLNNQLLLGAGGTEYIRANPTGVGIGTTNPTSALTVKGNTSLETLNVSGVSTFVGITTVTGPTLFTKQLSVSGVSTFNDTINFGSSSLSYTQPDTFISNNYSGGKIKLSAPYGVEVRSQGVGGDVIAYFANNPSQITYVELYYDNFKKFETIGAGVTVTGTTFTNQLSVSGIASVGSAITMYASTGIISATTFYGNVVGNITGSITNATNLTGGYANASQLNVSGIATISQGRIQADASSNLRFGNIAAGSGSVRNIAIGDQVLVSLSGGQGRNIGIGELSYYDTTTGQYNIGIGERAGQKVSTGSYNVVIGAYDGNSGGLDIRTSSRNVVIADGEGNIRQYINSSGNVGIKTTVVTEALTVAGIVSATGFYGTLNAEQLTGTLPAIDGSALIGVVGSGSGVIIEDDATPVGTAGTINFGTNLNVSFTGGTATVSASIPGINTTGTSTFNQLNVSGVSTFSDVNIKSGNSLVLGSQSQQGGGIRIWNQNNSSTSYFDLYSAGNAIYLENKGANSAGIFIRSLSNVTLGGGDNQWSVECSGDEVRLFYADNQKLRTTGIGVTVTGTTFTNQLSVSGNTNVSGIITASSFSGSGANLTNLPAGQLTGVLPAIDGSALLNVTASGTGIVVDDDNVNVGSAVTVNFGTGLDVTFSAGIATITASGGSLQSRTIVTGVTTSIANNGIGNTNITGFKSYALMRVGLSTAGWLRIYTDSASRDADVSRSVGEDPAPGSGVIAEVVTTGISTTQIISPFVMGGNLDNPADTTIYASIKNLSGSTQAITANLTILQLEA